jgi:hypothetical protein
MRFLGLLRTYEHVSSWIAQKGTSRSGPRSDSARHSTLPWLCCRALSSCARVTFGVSLLTPNRTSGPHVGATRSGCWASTGLRANSRSIRSPLFHSRCSVANVPPRGWCGGCLPLMRIVAESVQAGILNRSANRSGRGAVISKLTLSSSGYAPD